MRTIDELGISPTPWKSTVGKVHLNQVWDNSNGQILSGGYTESVSDARLIAAAPELYEALHELVRAFDMRFGLSKAARKGRVALAKASGEEVAK